MTNVPSGMPAPSATPTAAVASAPIPPVEVPDHSFKRGGIWVARAVSYLVYAYLLVVELILLIGFLLLLFGANPTSSFVDWAYRNLDRAMRPFRGIFAPVEIGTAGNDVEAIFETSVMFAMIVYGIVAIAVSALIGWLTHRIRLVDREHATDVARAEHEREIQALRDRATVLEAQQAAAQQAAAQQAAAQQAATQQAAATQAPAPPAPPTQG